jgi:calcium-dependent protein kinase
VFQEIDRNRDGTISKNEFRNGTYQFFGERAFMLEEEVDRIFDLVDMNGNGVIDYSEFISSAANVNQLMSEKQMKAAFKAFDLDGSGEISFEEFEETFSAGLEFDKDELRKIFTEFDHNKNGLINFEEFKSFMKRIFKIISN